MWETIVAGAIGGICWSVGGYIKNYQKDKKTKWKWSAFVKPLIVGGVVGVYSGYTDLTGQYEIISNLPFMLPLTGFVDRIASLIINVFKK